MNKDTIYIGLYQGKSLLSRFIKWFTWSKYSHASIVWMNEPDGVVVIYEAWSKGVTETHSFSENHTKGTRIDLYEFKEPLNLREKDAILEAAQAELGKSYDWKGIFSFILRVRMQRPGSWFCSEYATHCCLRAGRIVQDCPPWKIPPGDIAISPELRIAWRVTA